MQQYEIDAIADGPNDDMNPDEFHSTMGFRWTESNIYNRPEQHREMARAVISWLEQTSNGCTCQARMHQGKLKKCFEASCDRRYNAIECPLRCGQACQNRPYLSNQLVPAQFSVVHKHRKGFCLIANEAIDEGAFVMEYTGLIRLHGEYDPKYVGGIYVMQFYGTNITVDAEDYGSWARFCAHSHDPNLRVAEYVSDRTLRFTLIAERDIAAGTELTISYGEEYIKFLGKCFCLSPNCPDLPGKAKALLPATKDSAPDNIPSVQKSPVPSEKQHQSSKGVQTAKKAQQRPATAPTSGNKAVLKSKKGPTDSCSENPPSSGASSKKMSKTIPLARKSKTAVASAAKRVIGRMSSGKSATNMRNKIQPRSPTSGSGSDYRPSWVPSDSSESYHTATEEVRPPTADKKRQRTSSDSTDESVSKPVGKKLRQTKPFSSSSSASHEQIPDAPSTISIRSKVVAKKRGKPPTSSGGKIILPSNAVPRAASKIKVNRRKNSGSLFQCPYCDQTTTRKHDLQRHIKSQHKGISPEERIACPYPNCKKTFVRKDSMRRHMITHTEEFPFKCFVDGCDKQFQRKDVFQIHLRTHHNYNTEAGEEENGGISDVDNESEDQASALSSAENKKDDLSKSDGAAGSL